MPISIFKYLNNTFIFQTIPEINSFSALLFQCTDIASTYACAKKYAHKQPQGITCVPPCSLRDIQTLHLPIGPQSGSELTSWVTQACCTHAARLGFPLGHTAEYQCCSEGLHLRSLPAHRPESHHVLQQCHIPTAWAE